MKFSKTVAAAVLGLTLASGSVEAGGLAEPIMEADVIEEQAASSGGYIIPLVLLAILIAIASGGSSGGGGGFS